MEEEKAPFTSMNMTDQRSTVDQESQLKARINNNSSFQRAQAVVFRNISSVDKLIAYSLNLNCQSLERTKQQQIQSLISNFQQANMDAKNDGKKKFKNIIKNRFQDVVQEGMIDSEPASENEFDNLEDDDDNDYDDEDYMPSNQEENQDEPMAEVVLLPQQLINQDEVLQSQSDDQEDSAMAESDDSDSDSFHSLE